MEKEENEIPVTFHNVEVWAAHEHYPPSDAKIRNLRYESGGNNEKELGPLLF